ncbi:hypothetical protein Cgig2_012866 [Carnegiea gigantea]|uniref:dolichyl-diphosphooligosaccharide--protein glycotransferase n=1 Tax=Carnegiea gigantea TaxID=171969 RepID=A0A9Q1JY82_9CARY|nr:hypothetical protein Cgig2_012866 [Carnegiea gigantea]
MASKAEAMPGAKPQDPKSQMASTPKPSPDHFSFTSSFSLKSLELKTKQQELLIRVTILGLVYVLAFITRLFSVLRYESMIHEFDPYFNYRTTPYLTEKGFYDWYPLGQIIGGTLYPGLMVTTALIYWTLRFLRFAIHIREVCYPLYMGHIRGLFISINSFGCKGAYGNRVIFDDYREAYYWL